MKFIKVTTKSTQEDVNSIMCKTDSSYKDFLKNLEDSFENVEYEEGGFVAMYAVVDEKTLKRVFLEYANLDINFSYEDISKFILFGGTPKINGDNENFQLNHLIDKFVEENLDTDTVLDKINEIGFSFLTERDKKVLEIH